MRPVKSGCTQQVDRSAAVREVNEPTETTSEIRDDLIRAYTDQQLKGSFILHDVASDRWLYVDSAQADVATSPASTFKIFSTLYGLETGVVKDSTDVIKWDGTDYGRAAINKDLSLREAYDNSAYWFHREIARRAGPAVIKQWLDTIGYGNTDTTGGYDRTWVAGNLRISPRQQIEFLEKVQREELPFSDRTYAITKDIMIRKDTLGYVLRAKTGWAVGDTSEIGWYVGWVETPDGRGPFFFANRVMTNDTNSTTFASSRISITMEILKEQGIWPN